MTGAPYCAGDLVEVEVQGTLLPATVDAVHDTENGRFGLHWRLSVVPLGEVESFDVVCDDNGSNRTIGKRVRPSLLVAA